MTLMLRSIADASDPAPIIIWSMVLLGVVICGIMLMTHVKRRLQKADEPAPSGFTLAGLRLLHKSGQMSDEEFERAKAKVVEVARRVAEREPPPQEPPTQPPNHWRVS